MLVMLTVTPLAAILPTIADYFGVSADVAGWVPTAYLMTLTSLLLVSGRLGDLYGHRNVYLAGIILFTVVGTASGLSQNIDMLIVFRMLQGVAAALISGNSLAIITNTFSVKERGTAVGIIAMSASMGGILGVSLSTSMAQYLDWRWLFYLTLPVGLVGIITARYLQGPLPPEKPPKIDYLGAVILAIILIAFSLSFNHLHPAGVSLPTGWHYNAALLAVIAGGLLLFVVVERRAAQPLIELSYLLDAPFAFSIISNQILHMTMMASSFLMPFLLEKGLGLSPSHTAGIVISLSSGAVIASPLSGRIYDRTGWRFFCPLAMTLVCLGMGTMALFAPTMPYPLIMLTAFTLGLATGSFNTPNNVIIMSTTPADRRGFAAGMLETSRQFGHTVGVSISSAVLGAALLSTPIDVPKSAAFIIGYRQSCLFVSSIALLGILASLVPALWRREHNWIR
ncbi:MAG: MFS transporter [Dehalococcoidia bacterium]|nr:MFS transporter [Dehalococcoidia bacterium]